MKLIKVFFTNLKEFFDSICFHGDDNLEFIENRGVESEFKCNKCGATIIRSLADMYH